MKDEGFGVREVVWCFGSREQGGVCCDGGCFLGGGVLFHLRCCTLSNQFFFQCVGCLESPSTRPVLPGLGVCRGNVSEILLKILVSVNSTTQ